jgi:PAS domain S-box-containing protein
VKLNANRLTSIWKTTVCASALFLSHSAFAAIAPQQKTTFDLTAALGFGLIGLAIGAYLFSSRASTKSEDSPKSRRYLAALERISQGFTLFLRAPESSTPNQAIEWLLAEAAKTLGTSHASMWFYSDNRKSLELRYNFEMNKAVPKIDLRLSQKQHPAFFAALRGERNVSFINVAQDIRCSGFDKIMPETFMPKSMLVALVGIGNQAIGTLLICARSRLRKWNESDQQFVASIADLIAFYLSTRDLLVTQNALSESEARFRDIVAASSDWYWQTDENHRFSYISEKFSQLTGIHNSFFIGKTRLEICSHPNVLQNHQLLLKHLPFRDFHYPMIHDGKVLHVSVNGKPFFDSAGVFLGYRGTGSNITDTVTFKNRFDESINALPNGLAVWDSHDRLVLSNKALREQFSSLEKYADSSFTYLDLIKLGMKERIYNIWDESEETVITQMLATHRECKTREIELANGTHLLVQEQPTSEGGTVGIYTDITNLKSREKELIESNLISQALSSCVSTLIHARNESFILSEVCRIITGIDQFDSAWISLYSQQGLLPQFLELSMSKGLEIAHDEYQPSSLMKQSYIKQETIIFDQDELSLAYPSFTLPLIKNSIKSAGVFPIKVDTKIAGFLNVASKTSHAFEPHYINFIDELANDIGYGLSGLRSEQSRLVAEKALRESEGRYRSLIDMSPDAILVLDENDKILFANPAGNALFAISNRNELIHKSFANYVKDNEDIFVASPIQLHKESAETFSSITLIRANETEFEADMTSRPVPYGGLSTRLLIIRDVTERNKTLEQLAQTSKLATLGEMAAGITHELSQPLNIMRFAAEGTMLKMQRDLVNEEQIQKQFNLISQQCGRMADIIDHMRIFSRKDTGTIELFDPTIVVRQAIDMVEAQYFAEGIHLEIRYPSYYEMVKGRPIQLEQVILNLITNARDSILQNAKKNKTENKAHHINITMTFKQADHQINIAVTDTGGGIPPEAINKLFDPFFTTKEVGKGTGLGLSVSYGIISAMGGNINVRNIHHGARFDITLPCIKMTENELNANPASYPSDTVRAESFEDKDEDFIFDPDAIHVLVVDDEVYAAEAMMEYLFAHGYRVSMAGNGEEALELFDEEPADIVVTDIRMPKMDGHLLIKQLKQRNHDLPIIVVTGHTGMEDSDQEGIAHHAFSILKKPVSLSELVSEVERAIHSIKNM